MFYEGGVSTATQLKFEVFDVYDRQNNKVKNTHYHFSVDTSVRLSICLDAYFRSCGLQCDGPGQASFKSTATRDQVYSLLSLFLLSHFSSRFDDKVVGYLLVCLRKVTIIVLGDGVTPSFLFSVVKQIKKRDL